MTIKDQLQADLKDALRARDAPRKAVIRMTLAAITNAEVERRRELDEAETVGVLRKEARKRQETIAELRSVDRPEQLAKEEAELAILESYLPRLMTRGEIERAAQRTIAATGASSLAQMGPVMKELMAQIGGRADGRTVSSVVRELLTS